MLGRHASKPREEMERDLGRESETSYLDELIGEGEQTRGKERDRDTEGERPNHIPGN